MYVESHAMLTGFDGDGKNDPKKLIFAHGYK